MNKKKTDYQKTIVPYNATGIGFPASLPLNKIFMKFLKHYQPTVTNSITHYTETRDFSIDFDKNEIEDGKLKMALHMGELEDRKVNYGRTYDYLAKMGATQVYVNLDNGDVVRTNLFDVRFPKGSTIIVKYKPIQEGKDEDDIPEMIETVDTNDYAEWRASRNIKVIDMTYKYPPRNPYIRIDISITVARYLLDIRSRYGFVLDAVVHNTTNQYLPQVYNYLSVRRKEKEIEVPYSVVRKNIFGVDIPEINVEKYKIFAHFCKHCLDPVRKEMKQMFDDGTCDICFDYKVNRERGLKIGAPKSITFIVTYDNLKERLAPERYRIVEMMNRQLKISMNAAMELINDIHIMQLPLIEQKVIDLQQYCRENKSSIKNVGSYCYKSMQDFIRDLKRTNVRENKTEEVLDRQWDDLIFFKEQDLKREEEKLTNEQLWKQVQDIMFQEYPAYDGITRDMQFEFLKEQLLLKIPTAAFEYMKRNKTELMPYVNKFINTMKDHFKQEPTLTIK